MWFNFSCHFIDLVFGIKSRRQQIIFYFLMFIFYFTSPPFVLLQRFIVRNTNQSCNKNVITTYELGISYTLYCIVLWINHVLWNNYVSCLQLVNFVGFLTFYPTSVCNTDRQREIGNSTFLITGFGQARALLEWYNISRFCGHCGEKTVPMEAGRRKQCSNESCKKRIYPRVDPVWSPVLIVEWSMVDLVFLNFSGHLNLCRWSLC